MTQEVRKVHEIEELFINFERTGEKKLLDNIAYEIKDAYFCRVRLIDLIYILVSLKKNHSENKEYEAKIIEIKESCETLEAHKSIEKIVLLIIQLDIYVCATKCSFSINNWLIFSKKKKTGSISSSFLFFLFSFSKSS